MESFANLTDEMLVKLYAGGNNSAFDILLERYEEKIFSYIFLKSRFLHYPDQHKQSRNVFSFPRLMH